MGKQWVWYSAVAGLLWYLFVYKTAPSALAIAKARSSGSLRPFGNMSEPEQASIAQQAIASNIGVPYTPQGQFYSGFQRF